LASTRSRAIFRSASSCAGKFHLGNCAIDGLIVDYVFDSGDDAHYDTYQKLTGAPPRRPGSPPPPLANLSGKIQLTNSQINLYRGQTDPSTLHAVFESVRFFNIGGQLDIAALDQPWKYKIDGNAGITGEERAQTFASSGTLSLGQGGVFVPAALKIDATFNGVGVPTDLLPVLLPVLTSDDSRDAFGATFDNVDVKIKGDGGAVRMDILAESAGGRGHVHVKPTIDLNATPATLTMASTNPDDNLIAGGIPTGPARIAMARINPFALYAEAGTAVVRVASLEAPLTALWTIGSAKAELELHDVKLASPRGKPGS